MDEKLSRRVVLRGITAAGALSVTSGVVSARDTHKQVEKEYTDKSVADLAVDFAGDPLISEDPLHARIAFSTTVFDDEFELYLAEGVESVNDTPEKIFQITTNTTGGVLDLSWEKGNKLKFWRDGSMYRLKIPRSNKKFEPKEVKEKPMPDALLPNQGGDR